MEKIYYADAKTSQKNADVAILTQNKLDLRAKTIIRNKVVHFILIKGIVNDIIWNVIIQITELQSIWCKNW